MDNTVCVHASKLTGFREKKRGLLLMIILNKWVTSTVLKSGQVVKGIYTQKNGHLYHHWTSFTYDYVEIIEENK